MKELVYMIAIMIVAITNSEVNIEEIVKKPSIQQEEKVELGASFAFYDGTKFYYYEKDQKAFEYLGKTYKEGFYESILINLGKGEGNNFWCILFPPLCFTDEKVDVKYESFFKEVLSSIF